MTAASGDVPAPGGADPGLGRLARGAGVALLVAAFLLRIFPILWGSALYDEGQYGLHSDEPKILRYVDDFPGSILELHDYRYPTFVHNVCGMAWAGIGGLFGLRDEAPSEAGSPSYEHAMIFGRALCVLVFGMGGVLLTWAFTRRAFGPRAGLWALAASNLFVWTIASTALVQVDVCSAAALTLVFLLLLHVERAPRLELAYAAWIGMALGAAVASKYTAGIGVVGAAVVALAVRRSGRATWKQLALFTSLTAAFALMVFLIFVPGAIYDSAYFWNSLEYELRDKGSGVGSRVGFGQFLEALNDCLPWWLLLPAAAGYGLALRDRRSPVVIGVGLTLVLYVAATARAFKPDYGILAVPFVACFAGLFAERVARAGGRWATALLVAAVALGHLGAARAMVLRYTADTRYRFQDWALDHIPPGPLGEAPRATERPYWSCPKAPPGYEFVSVHDQPEWIVLNQRDSYTARMVIEAGREGFGRMGPRDLSFYRDVLLGERQRYRYDLVQTFEPLDLPLDKKGKVIEVYRRTETP